MTPRPVIEAPAPSWRKFGTIGTLLRRPAEAVDLQEFAEQLMVQSITFRLASLAPAAMDLALLGRIRGDLGEELLRAASPEAARGIPCPWQPPCAFEALFRKHGRMTPGTEFASPWVFSLAPHRDDLLVRMGLFGIACEWASAAAEALTVVLMERVDWQAAADGFVPAPCIESRHVETMALGAVPAGERLALDFLSPLVMSGRDGAADPRPAFTSFGLRLEGIARWYGLSLAGVDWRATAAALNALTWDWEEVTQVAWRRGSQRQDKWIPMPGVMGRLIVSGEIEPRLATLIRLGSLVHVGADIAFGCGRYMIAA
ncbi:MAG: CRISPR system precrRNA processing endoribonuclease RAMP protein Cas6 [Methylocella sp.]